MHQVFINSGKLKNCRVGKSICNPKNKKNLPLMGVDKSVKHSRFFWRGTCIFHWCGQLFYCSLYSPPLVVDRADTSSTSVKKSPKCVIDKGVLTTSPCFWFKNWVKPLKRSLIGRMEDVVNLWPRDFWVLLVEFPRNASYSPNFMRWIMNVNPCKELRFIPLERECRPQSAGQTNLDVWGSCPLALTATFRVPSGHWLEEDQAEWHEWRPTRWYLFFEGEKG